MIKHNSLWEWVMSKPSFLENICNFCSCLLGICAILDQPMAGLIIVMHHSLSRVFLFWGILYGPMRSTHSVSQGLVSACLGGSFPYFWLVVLDIWHVGDLLHTLWTVVQSPLRSKCWRIVCYVRVSPGWQIISWYQSIVFLCTAMGKNILLFRNIKLWFWSPPRKVLRV